MIIREAQEKDLKEISEMFNKLQITNVHNPLRPGFFQYSKSINDLKKSLNPYFFLAESEGNIKGFNLAYNLSFFKKQFSDSLSLEGKFISENFSEDFVYLDSFAVKNYSKLGSGLTTQRLFENLMNLAKNEKASGIVGCVCSKPYYNYRSSIYLLKKDFEIVNKIEVENNIQLDVYQYTFKFI